MRYSENEAYIVINKHIDYIDRTLKKNTNDPNYSNYSLKSLLVISQLLGLWNSDTNFNNPVYKEVRDNWNEYISLGCSKERNKYDMSFRGVLNLLIKFDFIVEETNEIKNAIVEDDNTIYYYRKKLLNKIDVSESVISFHQKNIEKYSKALEKVQELEDSCLKLKNTIDLLNKELSELILEVA